MKKVENKNIVIGTLIALVVMMSIGYAALTQQLTINGTAGISSTWKVAISAINQSDKVGNAVQATPPTNTDVTATFDVSLEKPGDSMTYDITVTNSGSLDALLKKVTLTEETAGSPAIKYSFVGVTEGVTTIDANGGQNIIKVKVEWDPAQTTMPEVLSKTATVVLDYEQI